VFFIDAVKSSDTGKLSLRNFSFASCPLRHLSVQRTAAYPGCALLGVCVQLPSASGGFLYIGEQRICPSAYLRVKGSSVTEDNSATLEYYILIVYLENNILY